MLYKKIPDDYQGKFSRMFHKEHPTLWMKIMFLNAFCLRNKTLGLMPVQIIERSNGSIAVEETIEEPLFIDYRAAIIPAKIKGNFAILCGKNEEPSILEKTCTPADGGCN